MKRIFLYTIVLSFITLSSCSDELDKRHTNPDGYTDAYIEFLYTQGAAETINNDYNDYWNYVIPRFSIYTQSIANTTTSDKAATYLITSDLNRWSRYYTTRMQELVEMNKIFNYATAETDKEQYVPYIQTGKVLMAYNTLMTTDLLGSIPYSEAWGARNGLYGLPVNLTPKYDSQQDIYNSVLDDLKDAAEFLSSNSLSTSLSKHNLFLTQDIVYGGDYDKWHKFANSLRLRAAMRISFVDETKAREVLGNLSLSDLITENADNAYTFKENTAFSGDWTGIWRAVRERRQYTYAPENMVNIFNTATDPRLPVYFQPPSDTDGAVTDPDTPIVGMPESADVLRALLMTTTQMQETYGIVNSTTVRNNNKLPNGIGITASDVYFLLAEARVRNLINWGDAEEFYNKGIILSVQEYYKYYNDSPATAKDASIAATDVSEATLLSWLSTSTYKYDSSKALEQIATQRWIHLWILQPFENWAEYRRTNLPVMVDDHGDNSLLNQQNAPVRVMYSTNEASLNAENYAAVAAQNNPAVKVWWDIE